MTFEFDGVPDICTARLDLIANTPAMVLSEQVGDGRLGELTHALVPKSWPPEHWEPHVLVWLLNKFAEEPRSVGWARFIALRTGNGTRTLIGTLGGSWKPDSLDECEMGWGVLPEFQGRGYATEGAQAFMAWVLTHPEIQSVSAQTLPSLPASIRVMEKCGMRLVGVGDEDGTVRYRWG